MGATPCTVSELIQSKLHSTNEARCACSHVPSDGKSTLDIVHKYGPEDAEEHTAEDDEESHYPKECPILAFNELDAP